MAANRVIGRDNALPWKLKADLARFKRLTMGQWLLVGRKTFESIGRPLPGRRMIVLTRRPACAPPDPGVHVVHLLEEALKLAADEELFIAGGEEVYRETLPQAHRLYLTLVHHDFPGDAFFPEFDKNDWALVSREDHSPDADNPYPYSFLVYERAK
jgi:dihydrofolate reductase